jgi:hypothetical protein
MKPLRNILLFFVSAGLMFSCVEPYSPPEISGNVNILVIDGFINATDNTCHVRLTRAVPISSKVGFAEVEEGTSPIQVILEDDQGFTIQLARTDLGVYDAPGLFVYEERKYRLRVKVPPAEEYVSDFIEIKETPPIEDVFFNVKPEEVAIMVNTSDPSGQNKYYRYSWIETWEYTSLYNSSYKLEGGEVVNRPEEEQLYRCYRTDPSSNIMIASTTNLSTDVVRNFELQTISKSSQKLQFRYSILVKQMALTEDAYTYWLNLYRTTENVGGLFDPLPGEVRGNFTSVKDATLPVIGYFGGSTVDEKRIFITPDDLPDGYRDFRHSACQADTIDVSAVHLLDPSNLLLFPVYAGGPPAIVGYLYAPVSCADCRRLQGGTTTKPPFWP